MRDLVMAGIDGSRSSLTAVEAAAREASLRGADLHLVHAVSRPTLPLRPGEDTRASVARVRAEAEDRARTTAPGVNVTSGVVGGKPTAVLTAHSYAARLMVVGSRGLGGLTGLMAGSTAVHLAAHGACPLLVVRAGGACKGPVVLAVDGSHAGAAAVRFAFTEAALRKADLLALHAWTPWSAPMPPPPDRTMPHAAAPGALAEHEACLLSEAIAGQRGDFPDVNVICRTVRRTARTALIDASRTARFLVVGARGHGGFAGLLLGSVSQALLHHAQCPVAVVKATARHDHPAPPAVRRRPAGSPGGGPRTAVG
ncbi:universal stress protein [Streptomyces albogriseolus]|uniref:universal stress protein n=1 Tax=Streptomyces albogriseolus TaxID=1887 RepID=UPI00345F5001